jgi:DNA-binding MarR family transcriptional regulator
MSSAFVTLSVEDSVRELMPRLVGRANRLPVPEELVGFELAPRHLSLLAFLLLGGPQSVSELARQLQLAPTTISLIVAELAEKQVLSRSEDPEDRRRRIVAIDPRHRGPLRGGRRALGRRGVSLSLMSSTSRHPSPPPTPL